MGKTLDALLRRSFKTGQFKATVNLAISRLSVLRNQRQSRCSIARSDVLELLNLGVHERALLRVELVIKEQNVLDVFVLIESYCHTLIERIKLIEHEKTCPDELKEAISSLIYAASRCGDFPELQEIREIFASRFGREFVARAVELRNNCGVNPKMITKLSTRMPSLENRMKVLKEIASENDIVLQLEEVVLEKQEEKKETYREQEQTMPTKHTVSGDFKMTGVLPGAADFEKVEGFSDSTEVRKKYTDVADAAQAAFESAAYAAAAARAAVELSRSDPHDPDDLNSPKLQPRGISSTHEPVKPTGGDKDIRDNKDKKDGMVFEKIDPVQNYSSESEREGLPAEDKMGKLKKGKNEAKFKKSPSTSSSESLDNTSNETKLPIDEDLLMKLQEREIVFYDTDDEKRNKSQRILSSTNDFGYDTKQTLHGNDISGSEKPYTMEADVMEESHRKPYSPSRKHFPLRSQGGLKLGKAPENSNSYFAADHLDMEKAPISVRTRRTYGRRGDYRE